jgi:phosphotransferase system IIB component
MIVASIVVLASFVAAAEPSDDSRLSKVVNITAVTNKATRLCLEVVSTEPVPVIGANHPDAKDIPAGFEAGTTVKVTINGQTAYHMVTTTMETTGATRWANMRTEHWLSNDGTNWKRHKILFRPGKNSETGMWELTGSTFFFFDEKANRWFVYFNFMAYDRIRPWGTPTLLRRAGAKTKGPAGINGEFEYPGEIVAPSVVAQPSG